MNRARLPCSFSGSNPVQNRTTSKSLLAGRAECHLTHLMQPFRMRRETGHNHKPVMTYLELRHAPVTRRVERSLDSDSRGVHLHKQHTGWSETLVRSIVSSLSRLHLPSGNQLNTFSGSAMPYRVCRTSDDSGERPARATGNAVSAVDAEKIASITATPI